MLLEAPNDEILQEDLEWIANKEENLKNCTVLITGATGLIGSQIVKSLLCKNRMKGSNIKVIALVRSEEKVKEVFKYVLKNENLKFVYGDILESFQIEDEIDYIIHAASITSSKNFIERPIDTIKCIVNGTDKVLELARMKKVQGVIYLSSMEAFGITDPKKKYILEEDLGYIDLMDVRSCYSEGKRMAENLCVAYYSQYNVPVKIVRLAQTFGPDISKSENRIFAQIARNIINKEDIVLHTKGDSITNCCYTRDAIWGVLLLFTKGRSGQVYTITNESSCMSIFDMAKLAVEKIAEDKVKIIIEIPEDLKSYGYAPKKKMKLSAKKMNQLGWKAEIGMVESYIRMMKSMEARING